MVAIMLYDSCNKYYKFIFFVFLNHVKLVQLGQSV